MATSRVQQAIEEYTRVVKQAANDYEDMLRKAELDLRAAMNSSNAPEPPNSSNSDPNVVTLKKDDFEKIQNTLNLFESVVKEHPELFK